MLGNKMIMGYNEDFNVSLNIFLQYYLTWFFNYVDLSPFKCRILVMVTNLCPIFVVM